ncbi:unnamed protein product [Echinostoma caproni]|uniref:Leucine-rich repeat-containing protein 34 n=1 Tax=Echinostoma caproni TaxID=27848 RepID=A0A183AJ78_9TREM|nr:unnamed protein product [Echinostoma caproni]
MTDVDTVNLENLADLEETYVRCLGSEETPACGFIRSMISREYERDIKDENLFAIYLKLCGNNRHMDAIRLTDDDLQPICSALLTKPCVSSLDLRYNRLTDIGAKVLATFLLEYNLLEELNLMGNDIGALGATYIADALKNITSCVAFATMLRGNRALKGINLNRQLLWTLQEEPTVHIAKMLCVNSTLKELHLSKVDMRDFGAERLAEAMELSTQYYFIFYYSSRNRIARDGALALSRVVAANCSLVILDLAFNRIQCAGARAMASALLSNTHLKVLCVQFCELKGPGLCALAEALITNSTLQCIYIWGNEHDESTCIAYSNLLQTGRLTEDSTDVRPYVVDNRTYLALLDHDCTYRMYRFSVPWWKGFAPSDRSVALF